MANSQLYPDGLKNVNLPANVKGKKMVGFAASRQSEVHLNDKGPPTKMLLVH